MDLPGILSWQEFDPAGKFIRDDASEGQEVHGTYGHRRQK